MNRKYFVRFIHDSAVTRLLLPYQWYVNKEINKSQQLLKFESHEILDYDYDYDDYDSSIKKTKKKPLGRPKLIQSNIQQNVLLLIFETRYLEH